MSRPQIRAPDNKLWARSWVQWMFWRQHSQVDRIQAVLQEVQIWTKLPEASWLQQPYSSSDHHQNSQIITCWYTWWIPIALASEQRQCVKSYCQVEQVAIILHVAIVVMPWFEKWQIPNCHAHFHWGMFKGICKVVYTGSTCCALSLMHWHCAAWFRTAICSNGMWMKHLLHRKYRYENMCLWLLPHLVAWLLTPICFQEQQEMCTTAGNASWSGWSSRQVSIMLVPHLGAMMHVVMLQSCGAQRTALGCYSPWLWLISLNAVSAHNCAIWVSLLLQQTHLKCKG